jgi:hypothetical protein
VKRCKTCLHWKPREAFAKHDSTADRLEPNCRTCEAKRNAEWFARNRERRRQYAEKYRQRPEAKEYQRDYGLVRRAMKRMAKARTKGLTPDGTDTLHQT